MKFREIMPGRNSVPSSRAKAKDERRLAIDKLWMSLSAVVTSSCYGGVGCSGIPKTKIESITLIRHSLSDIYPPLVDSLLSSFLSNKADRPPEAAKLSRHAKALNRAYGYKLPAANC